MTPRTDRPIILGDRLAIRRAAGVLAAALLLSGLGLTGCGVVSAVNKVKTDVESNKALIDQFTNSLKSGAAKPFEATYVTTGSSPTKIVYAVRQPNGLLFRETAAGSRGAEVSNADIIVNSSGEYSCSPPAAGSGSGSGGTCRKLGKAGAAAKNQILDFYTPSHWVAFLRDFSVAAGFAGDKVTSSSLTVNGFRMKCVDFRAAGVAGTSKICTTAQGILGYVRVASDTTSFEITSYSSSPPASLFKLPPGAKVTTPKQGTA
jgi:outer membrane murein-binding lipoprotein Lpp